MVRHPDSHQLFIGNLPHEVDKSELKDFFQSRCRREDSAAVRAVPRRLMALCPCRLRHRGGAAHQQWREVAQFWVCRV